MKVIVDVARCSGHARCKAKGPDFYRLNSDGYNEMNETVVPPGMEEQARRGAAACPERAIKLVE